MKFARLFFIILLVPKISSAGILFQYSGGYTSYTNDNEEINFTRLLNSVYLGASLGRKTRFMLGPSYTLWNQSHQTVTDIEISMKMSEFGATALLYLNKSLNWQISATYCMSVNGTRKAGGTEETIKGNAMRFGLGYHAPITESLAIGGSVSYHITNITSSIVNKVESEVEVTYTQILPMIELVLRY